MAHSQQAVRLLDMLHPVEIVIAHPDMGVALQFVGDARHRDAALDMADGLPRDAVQHRIGIGPDVAGRQLQHDQPQRHTDMRRGDADAGRAAHRVEQIGRKLAQIGVEAHDGRRRHAQTRIGKTQDRTWRHT